MKRILVALVGIPVSIACALSGGLWLWGFVVALQFLALWEWRKLTSSEGATLDFPLTGVVVLALDVMLARQFDLVGNALFLSALVILLVWETLRSHHRPLTTLGSSLLFAFYVALPFALWTQLDQSAAGSRFAPLSALLMLWVATWLCDSAAYYGGSTFGKHLLYPAASPKKTVEGFLFGAAGAFIAAPCMHLFFDFQLTYLDYTVLGISVGLLGQVGDLLESLVKRQAGVKDSSSLLPGHGGILDRFDSLLLSTPAFFSYLLVTSR